MSAEWYYSVDGDRQGPVSAQELKKLVEDGTVKPADLVWKDGMGDWVAAKTIKGLFPAGASSAGTPAATKPVDEKPAAKPTRRVEPEDDDEAEEEERPRKRREVAERDDDDEDEDRRPRKKKSRGGLPADVSSKKMTAGILGILLNAWGIHKFYLGMTGAGLTMLLVSLLTCGLGAIVMWPIGLIEGIIYLTKSDEDFYEIYMVQKKSWF